MCIRDSDWCKRQEYANQTQRVESGIDTVKCYETGQVLTKQIRDKRNTEEEEEIKRIELL